MSILFTNVTAVTMDPAQPLLKNGCVATDGIHITYVGTDRPQGDFDRIIDCTGKVMMPGAEGSSGKEERKASINESVRSTPDASSVTCCFSNAFRV